LWNITRSKLHQNFSHAIQSQQMWFDSQRFHICRTPFGC
jgi:hypothetical protein